MSDKQGVVTPEDYYAENASPKKEFRPGINIRQRRAEGLGSAGKDFRVRV